MTFSRFYLCDLQVHTPADTNQRYGDAGGPDPNLTFARRLIQAHAEAGVQVVAVTDHNRVDWYPVLAEAADEFGVTVFPGLEVSVNGCHLLGIWDCTGQGYDFAQQFLQSLWDPGVDRFDNGHPRPVGRGQVREIVEQIQHYRGLPFAPHTTTKRMGLFAGGVCRNSAEIAQSGLILGFDVYGDKLADVLKNPRTEFADVPPRWFITSDCRSFEDVGTRPIYLKLGPQPNLESLRQAFVAGDTRIRFPVKLQQDWGHIQGVHFLTSPTPSWPHIETIEIKGGFHDGLTVQFGPGLNAIIGGKGTGKSTLIEIMRYVLDAGDPIEEDLKSNRRANFRANAEASIAFCTDSGERHTSQRSGDDLPARLLRNGTETNVPVDRRVRVRVFGQRELQRLVERQDLRREFVAAQIGDVWQEQNLDEDKLLSDLRKVDGQLDSVEQGLLEMEELATELADLREKLARAEERGVRNLLQELEILTRDHGQVTVALNWPGRIRTTLQTLKDQLPAPLLPEHISSNSMRTILNELADVISTSSTQMSTKIDETEQRLTQPQQQWADAVRQRRHEINALLAEAGFANLQEISGYQQRATEIEHHIAGLQATRDRLSSLQDCRVDLLHKISDRRRAKSRLVEKAARELTDAVGKRVRVRVQPLADSSEVLSLLQEAVKGQNVRRDQLSKLAQELPMRIGELLREGSTHMQSLGYSPGAATALGELSPTKIREIEEAPTPDTILIEINLGSDINESWTPVEQASPGQRATAMLALALTSGNDPLIIDQPEDDLDNRHIYQEVVKVLSRVCNSRQVIVATHNANIPVLGDAELILALDAAADRSSVLACGGLENPVVAEHARHILEGGDEAFKARHARYLSADV